jgi:hypothetical protein
LTEAGTEGFLVHPVGINDVKILILNRDEAGYFFKELTILPPTSTDIQLKIFQLGDIGGHLDDFRYLAIVIKNRCRVDQHRDLPVAEGSHEFFAAVVLAIGESPSDGTVFTSLGPLFVNLVAIPTAEVTKVTAKRIIGFDNPKVTILHGQIPGHSIEYPIRKPATLSIHC